MPNGDPVSSRGSTARESSRREFRAVLAELKSDVEHHLEEEESEGFPKLRDAVDQAKLDELGSRVEEAKQAAS